MNVGVITFPGSNCDHDAVRFFEKELGAKAQLHWYQDLSLLEKKYDLVIAPGGFSYGDYLRSGAIAARSAILNEVRRFADKGGWVLGICNGFQILTESGLLPGALTDNIQGGFTCRVSRVTAQKARTPWLPQELVGKSFDFPVAHAQGRYVIDATQLERLEGEGQVVWRYEDNFNGSMHSIAGVCNSTGRVLGMMPHPERHSDGVQWLRQWRSKLG